MKARNSLEFWEDRHRATAEKRIYPSPSRRLLDFELDRFFGRRLAGRRGGRILEIGCGGSLWLPYFGREFGLRLAGVDISESGLAAARAILRRHGLEGDLRRADFRELGKADAGAYDFVFSLGLIEHLDDPEAGVRAMAALLAPGGLLLTWTPYTAGPILRLSRRLNPDLSEFYADLDLDRLAGLHRRAGLGVEEAAYVQFLDFTILSLARIPRSLRSAAGRLLRALSLPVLFVEKATGSRVQRPAACAGLVVAARKP